MSQCSPNGSLFYSLNEILVNNEYKFIYFNNISINQSGMYLLKAIIRSTDGEYDFSCLSSSILVKKESYKKYLNFEMSPNIFLKFEHDFNENQNRLHEFRTLFFNCIVQRFNMRLKNEINIYPGSIMINAELEGSIENFAVITDFLMEGFSLSENISLASFDILDNNYTISSNQNDSFSTQSTESVSTNFQSISTSTSTNLISTYEPTTFSQITNKSLTQVSTKSMIFKKTQV